jgi:hypothetical protein
MGAVRGPPAARLPVSQGFRQPRPQPSVCAALGPGAAQIPHFCIQRAGVSWHRRTEPAGRLVASVARPGRAAASPRRRSRVARLVKSRHVDCDHGDDCFARGNEVRRKARAAGGRELKPAAAEGESRRLPGSYPTRRYLRGAFLDHGGRLVVARGPLGESLVLLRIQPHTLDARTTRSRSMAALRPDAART